MLLHFLMTVPHSTNFIHNLPRPQARISFQSREKVASFENLHNALSATTVDRMCQNSFVLNRIHTAGRVDHSTSHLEHLQCAHEDANLRGMKPQSIARGPIAPDFDVLPRSTITGTGHIRQDAVKFEISVWYLLAIFRRLGGQFD